MKKFFCPLLALLLSILLIGCGSKNIAGSANETGNDTNMEELTRAQWIGMLGDRFGYTEAFEESDYYSDVKSDNPYYGQIQACAEWEVAERGSAFEPDKAADWNYIIETAVRAIGLDNINRSTVGVTVAEGKLAEFFTSNIANIGGGDLNVVPPRDEAVQALDYSYEYYMNLTPADVYEVSYNDGVCEVEADAISLKGDGFTAIVNDGASYKAGDVIYVQPSDKGGAYALKVNSCDEEKGLVTYELAEMEDVFEEMVISGSYDAVIIGAEAADYVSMRPISPQDLSALPVFTNNMRSYARPAAFSYRKETEKVDVDVKVSGEGIKFNVKHNKSKLDFAVSLTDFKTNTDIDFGIFKGLKKANATVSFKDKIELKQPLNELKERFSQTIPLGKATIQLGSTPLQVVVSLVANIGLDGEITLTYTSTVVGKVEYSKGKSLTASVSNNSPTFDMHAQVTITAEPTVKVDLRCFDRSIVNFKVTSGIVGIATVDVDLMGKLPACIDLYLYVPLRWAVNEDGCVMTAISSKLKKSQTVWDSKNSPITQRFHWEDLVLVDECTRGKEEKVETPEVTEEGVPYDEYKIFEFEELEFGFIDVASTNILLENGETMSIGILEVPNGYSKSDLVYTLEDANTGVCSVSGGKITGTGSGSTILKISTPDGKYSVFVAVIVFEEYHEVSTLL